MYFFSNVYKKSIFKDYLKKVNLNSFEKIKSKKGDNLKIFFSQSVLKKQSKKKLKHCLVLELLSLKKSLFFYSISKLKRKKTYIPVESKSILTNKYLYYFFFNFLKTSVSNIPNLILFTNNLNIKKVDFQTINTFNVLNKNLFYFSDLIELKLELKNKTLSKKGYILMYQLLSFYKLKL
jgi:hypothetical protein